MPGPSPCPCSPYVAKPFESTSDIRRPPEHLVDHFGGALDTGEPTVLTPRVLPTQIHVCPHPVTPDLRSQHLSSPPYQRERVSQVKFVEHDAVDCVLIDTGASIHLSGSARFATNLKDVPPFRIFLPT
ncbi:hypothetical protein O181_025668 [Austropuccinia psidii MF-1]|uniref:Uncharacterized protein n=1 Tax=Austropuccinia psidii MF-1 TaxID=1389203 RepID=A0A9Q3CNA3_9BASI|nr:hypothetical protein [Austropuccinia psidii MF-1]